MKYTIRAGDTIASVAAAVGIDVSDLCAAVADMQGLLTPGITIDVPDAAGGQEPAGAAPDAAGVIVSPGRIVQVAQPGTMTVGLIDLSESNTAVYVVCSGDFYQQGEIAPRGAAVIPARHYDNPVFVGNVTNRRHPADIQVSIVTS
jgi:hypothetical protein